MHRENLIDADWKFSRTNIAGAESINFNDSDWRPIDLPHDWSIEDIPHSSRDSFSICPFFKKSPGGRNTGYVLGGIAWYRKHLILPDNHSNKSIMLRFDGVYNECEVWPNGHHLGFHPNGYTPFNYDITDFSNKNGKQNMIAVRVRNEGINSRWYSGSGIYRHVWLTVTDRVHIPVWGVGITSKKLGNQSSQVDLKIKVQNQSFSPM